jgi:hypothetical protein
MLDMHQCSCYLITYTQWTIEVKCSSKVSLKRSLRKLTVFRYVTGSYVRSSFIEKSLINDRHLQSNILILRLWWSYMMTVITETRCTHSIVYRSTWFYLIDHSNLLQVVIVHVRYASNWIYNYLWNQCLSPLMLWVRLSIRARWTTLCNQVSMTRSVICILSRFRLYWLRLFLFTLLLKTCKMLGIPILRLWRSYMMTVITETRCTHYIVYRSTCFF